MHEWVCVLCVRGGGKRTGLRLCRERAASVQCVRVKKKGASTAGGHCKNGAREEEKDDLGNCFFGVGAGKKTVKNLEGSRL